MQSPLQIHFPRAFCGKLKVATNCSIDFEYQLPFTQKLQTSCELGDFLAQYINGEDYRIELLSFVVKCKGYLEIEVFQPSVCLVMFICGNINGNLVGHGKVSFPSETYNLFYFPVGTHRLDLVKCEYTLFFIIPPKNYLNSMGREHARIQEIVDRAFRENDKGTFLTTFPLPQAASRMIKRLERTRKKEAGLDFELRQCILEILALYNEQFKNNEPGKPVYLNTKEKALAAREYILANLGDSNLGGLTELARRFYISTKTLTKEFKLYTGKTIPKFIIDERMKLAEQLLLKNVPVYDIAQLVGFSDTANFIRSFKKKFGYTPGSRLINHRSEKQ